jgi:hypothetical protein
MNSLVRLPALLLFCAPFLTRCTNASSHEKLPAPPGPAVKKHRPAPDSLTTEPQITHIAHGDLKSQISRVVCYSYLDIEDYEEDTFTRAPNFQMMPGFSRPMWKYDPHPKVVLTKKQTRKLLAILGTPATYKTIHSNCLSPRNCFCFYNSKKEIVGYYEVSFENGREIAVPNFTGSESGTLSEKGVRRLRSFCRSAGITAR